MASENVVPVTREEGQQTDPYVPSDVLVALAIAVALRDRDEREIEEELEEEEEEGSESMLTDPPSPARSQDGVDFSQDSFSSHSTHVSPASETPIAHDGAETTKPTPLKPAPAEDEPVVEDQKLPASVASILASIKKEPREMDEKPVSAKETSVPPATVLVSPQLRRSSRNHRVSVQSHGDRLAEESKKAKSKVEPDFKIEMPAEQEEEPSIPLTPPPDSLKRRACAQRRLFDTPGVPSVEAASSEDDDDTTGILASPPAKRLRERPPRATMETNTTISTPRISKEKATEKASGAKGEIKLSRRDFDHRRAGTKPFWSRLIGVQVDWMRKLGAGSFRGAEVVGFANDSWDLLAKSFSWLKSVRPVEVHHLMMHFLGNSIKIYELLVLRGFDEVFTCLPDFVRSLLRKFLSFPKKMSEVDLRWIQAREAIKMVLNHLTQKELLLTVMTGLVDVQQRFLATWTTTEEPPAEMDMVFVCYGIGQLTAFVSDINARLQQAQRMEVFGLGF